MFVVFANGDADADGVTADGGGGDGGGSDGGSGRATGGGGRLLGAALMLLLSLLALLVLCRAVARLETGRLERWVPPPLRPRLLGEDGRNGAPRRAWQAASGAARRRAESALGEAAVARAVAGAAAAGAAACAVVDFSSLGSCVAAPVVSTLARPPL